MAKTLSKLTLTSSNYYSVEMDKQFMSVSQFKGFMECEAAEMAYLKEGVDKEPTKPMIVGSYVHSAFEGDDVFNEFVEEHSDVIFKKRGGKYAEFVKADTMIEALRNDDFAMFAMQGEKEQIFTANLFGCEWKMKVDSINHDLKIFSDLKTTRNIFERHWSTKYEGWTSFVERWDYVLQMAVYRRIIEQSTGNRYTPYIVAVSKEGIPNKAVISFDESRFGFEYDYVEYHIQRILDVKSGVEEPKRCEKCEYCRRTKKLSGAIEVGDLIYA